MIDVNVYQEKIFHTKMMLKDLKLDDYLLGVSKDELTLAQQRRIHRQVRREMLEMFYGRNMKRGLRMK
jgi:S-adenosylmethionine decarboxylase